MLRFRARIEKDGVNAFVDIPERVSRAFRPHARSGRVRVEGSINGKPVRGTLVPSSSGRQRFFVTLAARRAASVEPGSVARFEFRPSSWDIETPEELSRGLARVKGALSAFRALAPSHRRELIRYIDDAKTEESKRRRIEKTAEHVLGRSNPLSRGRKDKPMWACPRCGNEFVNRNQYHSCRRVALSDVFAGSEPRLRELFDRLRAMIESFGAVKLVNYRNRVAFMVRVRFAGASPRKKWLDVRFWVTRRIPSPRFRRVETIVPNVHLHSLRISEPGELDRELRDWLKEAYQVGCQKHLA